MRPAWRPCALCGVGEVQRRSCRFLHRRSCHTTRSNWDGATKPHESHQAPPLVAFRTPSVALHQAPAGGADRTASPETLTFGGGNPATSDTLQANSRNARKPGQITKKTVNQYLSPNFSITVDIARKRLHPVTCDESDSPGKWAVSTGPFHLGRARRRDRWGGFACRSSGEVAALCCWGLRWHSPWGHWR
jgi:hypothetical protein